MKKYIVILSSLFLFVSCVPKHSQVKPEKLSKDEQIAFLEQENRELEETKQKFFTYFMWLLSTILGGAVILTLLNIHESRKKDKIIYSSEQFLHYSIQVQEAERKRISQELHDSVAQSLRYVTLLAENLDDKEAAQKIITTQNENIENIRKLCYNLTPPAIKRNNLFTSLEFLGQQLFDTEHSDFQFRMVCDQSVTFEKWNSDQLMNIYRIVQEALQNIKKHAEANETTVFFKTSGQTLKIIITDDGKGMSQSLVHQINSGSFDQTKAMHFGLRNIFERVKFLNGKVTYFSEEDSGTRLTVEI